MSLIVKGLGAELKELRQKTGLSLREVDKLTGISYTHLNMIENEKRSVTPALLRNLANVYNVNYLDLYVLAGYLDLVEDAVQRKDGKASAVVFIYGTIPAGVPMEMIEDIIDTEEIDASMLKGGKQYFGLKIKGNSMSPEYRDGDIIICEKVDDCESGDECIVMVNGNDGTFKKVIKDKDAQTIRLQPINTSLGSDGKPLFEPITYTREQVEQLPVKIIGKVVELRRKK